MEQLVTSSEGYLQSAIDAFTSMLMSGKQFGLYSVQVFQYEAVQLKVYFM